APRVRQHLFQDRPQLGRPLQGALTAVLQLAYVDALGLRTGRDRCRISRYRRRFGWLDRFSRRRRDDLVEYELILRLWLTQPAFVRGRHGFADPMTLEQLVAEYAQSAQCSRHVRLPPGLEERRRCGEDVARAAEYVEPLVPDRDIQLADHAGQILDGAQCLGEHGDVVETRGTEQSTLAAQHGAERLAVHRVVGQCGDAAVQLGGDRSDLVCRVLEERACLLRPRL